MSDSVWLVTGGSGQVGGALVAAPPRGVRIVAPTRAELDLADPALDPAGLMERHGVTAIVNCGAYTQVDRAESEEALATQVNGHAPGVLARAAAAAGIGIVQVSTDYVFAGNKAGAYAEDDPTGPRGAYGRGKLEGELQVAAAGARHAIVRTAWVFGPRGQNFLRTMLRLGAECDALRVVADQHGCPTHAGDLAQALATITSEFERGDGRSGVWASGIWHVANAGETTWYGFAERIFARAAQHGRTAPEVIPIAAADYPAPAPRPAYSQLATGKARDDFGIALRPWQDASDAAVDALLQKETTV